MRDAPLLTTTTKSRREKNRIIVNVSRLNVFALILFACSVVNLLCALKRSNIDMIRREGENVVVMSSSSSSSSSSGCEKLSGKASYEECVERKNKERRDKEKIRERLRKTKEANVRNYYEQRRKQKQEKFKERDEEKERFVLSEAKGSGGENGIRAALSEEGIIREASVLEKPLETLEVGNGGRFIFPEEEKGTTKMLDAILKPCAGTRDRNVETTTTWLDAPERFERQNIQTRKKEFGKLSKKKVTIGNVLIKYHDKASLVLLPSGQVVAFWQSGKNVEGERGQHVRVATSEDEGVTFGNSWPLFSKYDESEGGEIEDEEVTAQWTPVPHVDKDGNLLLFYAESDGGC